MTTEEEQAALDAERAAFKRMRETHGPVTAAFAACARGNGTGPTIEQLRVLKAAIEAWEAAKARVNELVERVRQAG